MTEHAPGPVAPPIAKTSKRVLRWVMGVAVILGMAFAAYFSREHWLHYLQPTEHGHVNAEPDEHDGPHASGDSIQLSEQAQKNLKLTAKPLKQETFWKTVSIPGMVIDRPGFSDRGIVAPATGVVSRIHRVAGDTVKPGDLLFTLKLLSEPLQLTQGDLFKTTQDLKLAEEQKKRLAASSGVVSEAKLIEVDNQITRFQVGIKAFRQQLLNWGITSDQIDGISSGMFVNEMKILAPNRSAEEKQSANKSISPNPVPHDFEIQELKVELGQQVQSGQTLCLLANHEMLAVEGRAFRDESPLLERVVKEDWPVTIDFAEDNIRDWPSLEQNFRVNYIANTIDPETRTFRFLLPLNNQSRTIEKNGGSQHLWRFRPGQRVRLLVRVEAVENVFVLPTDAVVREGAEAFVFRQNGDTFERKPVQIVYQDRLNVVLANEGSVLPGAYVAQTGAAQLNRMIKSQTSTMPKGFHIHADGTVHGNH